MQLLKPQNPRGNGIERTVLSSFGLYSNTASLTGSCPGKDMTYMLSISLSFSLCVCLGGGVGVCVRAWVCVCVWVGGWMGGWWGEWRPSAAKGVGQR